MLEDAHRETALRIEQPLADPGHTTAKPHIVEALIELSWSAAFQWIDARTSGLVRAIIDEVAARHPEFLAATSTVL